jgi:hypothetical protein
LAKLEVQGDELVLQLSTAERIEGVHGDLRVPLATVRGIDLLDDAHKPAGIRAGIKVGTRIPGVIEVGSVQGRKRRLFAAVHHDTPRGLRVQLEAGAYDEWIVGLEDPEGVLAQIRPWIRPNRSTATP